MNWLPENGNGFQCWMKKTALIAVVSWAIWITTMLLDLRQSIARVEGRLGIYVATETHSKSFDSDP